MRFLEKNIMTRNQTVFRHHRLCWSCADFPSCQLCAEATGLYFFFLQQLKDKEENISLSKVARQARRNLGALLAISVNMVVFFFFHKMV